MVEVVEVAGVVVGVVILLHKYSLIGVRIAIFGLDKFQHISSDMKKLLLLHKRLQRRRRIVLCLACLAVQYLLNPPAP